MYKRQTIFYAKLHNEALSRKNKILVVASDLSNVNKMNSSSQIDNPIGLNNPLHVKSEGGLGLLSHLFNPSLSLVLVILGYYSLAPFTNRFLSEGNVGGIFIHFFIIFYVASTYLINFYRQKKIKRTHCSFGLIFLFLYGLRMFDNIYFDGLILPPDNTVVVLFFLVNTVLVSLLTMQMSWQINDVVFYKASLLLFLIFMIGMSQNIDVLSETSARRLSLTKINPISLSHQAISFAIFFWIYFGHSFFSKIAAFLSWPLLFLIIVYARSRGGYLAILGVLMIFIIAKGGRDKLFSVGLFSTIFLIAIFFISDDFKNVIFEPIQRLFTGDDQSANIREQLFNLSWGLFLDFPILGDSIITPIFGVYTHNLILEGLISTGLLGVSFLTIHLSFCLNAVFQIIRKNIYPKFTVLIALLFIQKLIGLLVSGNVWGSGSFWAISFSILFIYYGRLNEISR